MPNVTFRRDIRHICIAGGATGGAGKGKNRPKRRERLRENGNVQNIQIVIKNFCEYAKTYILATAHGLCYTI